MPDKSATIQQVLRRWAAQQKSLLEKAFQVGGHQHHGGEIWTPLAENTAEAKGKFIPLVGTGRLSKSFFFKVSGTTAMVGNSSNIAIFHQDGTKSIPKRTIVTMTRQDIDRLKRDLKQALES